MSAFEQEFMARVAESNHEIEQLVADRLARVSAEEAIELVRGDASAFVDLAQQLVLAHTESVLRAAAIVQRHYDADHAPDDEAITALVLAQRMELLDAQQ